MTKRGEVNRVNVGDEASNIEEIKGVQNCIVLILHFRAYLRPQSSLQP